MSDITTINKIQKVLMKKKKIQNDIITNNQIFLKANLMHNITKTKTDIYNKKEKLDSVLNNYKNNFENVYNNKINRNVLEDNYLSSKTDKVQKLHEDIYNKSNVEKNYLINEKIKPINVTKNDINKIKPINRTQVDNKKLLENRSQGKLSTKEIIKNSKNFTNNKNANIEVNMINNNSINQNLDINAITSYLKDSLKQTLQSSIDSY